MDKMREEYAKLFNEFADKYDQFSNQWQDMTIEEVFIQGCIASRAALVVELPRSFKDMYDQYVYDEQSVKDLLDKAGIKWTE